MIWYIGSAADKNIFHLKSDSSFGNLAEAWTRICKMFDTAVTKLNLGLDMKPFQGDTL